MYEGDAKLFADLAGDEAARIAAEPLALFMPDCVEVLVDKLDGEIADAVPVAVIDNVLTSAKTVSETIDENLDDFIFTAGTPSDLDWRILM
jgi:hypothetical protein